MVEGESGILAVCPPEERPLYKKQSRCLVWPNGAKSLIFTADEPERLRGKQHGKLWADELAAWRYPESWDQAMLGLRLGKNPQAIVTTTPRPTRLIRSLVADKKTAVTRGSTYDNKANLAPSFLSEIIKQYEGTRLGRQELNAEILEDNPNALWKHEQFDAPGFRVDRAPHLKRIVVAIDPAVTSEEGSDAVGIVAAGIGADGHGYVLEDATVEGATPNQWGVRSIRCFTVWDADRMIAEVNQGGDLVERNIRATDGGRNIPFKKIHATRGKTLRAEPVAGLYEQNKVHHVGVFAKMEDEMCDWNPCEEDQKSPNRMDALVYALTELMIGPGQTNVKAPKATVTVSFDDQALGL